MIAYRAELASRVVQPMTSTLAPSTDITVAFQALAASDLHFALAASPGVVSVLRGWAYGYLRRRFGWSSRHRGPTTHRALVDDALQHLLMAVLAGKAGALGGANLSAFVTWCKRVLDNFVISEYRLVARSSPPIESARQSDPGARLEVRDLLSRLVALLRLQVAQTTRHRDASRRLALLDEFLDSLFGDQRAASEATSACRRYQRLSRGRRVAASAWAELCRTHTSCAELYEIAAALGLETARAVRESPRRASVGCAAPAGSSRSIEGIIPC
jgi:hypothetical protein